MPSLDLAPGAVFARDYTIVRPLSEGGMGAVYVVQQTSTGAHRALKLMHQELVQDPRLRERFVLEARISARIESEHVVQVLGAGVDEQSGMPWLVMELLQGEDLAGLIARRGALPPAEVRDIFAQLTHAIAAAHRVGVVHRDLKPENVFIARPRSEGLTHFVKVLDFGIAKVAAEARATATQALGTPIWMAPEQTERRVTITPAADVWALGLIAFRALTGCYFWHAAGSEESSFAMVLREVVIDAIPSASARAADYGVAHLLPPGFDAWFARCVARDPAARFENAGLAREAFAEIIGPASTIPSSRAWTTPAAAAAPGAPLQRTPVATAPGAPLQRTPVAAQTQPVVGGFTPSGPQPPQPKPPSSSGKAPLLAAAGVVLAAALGLGGRSFLRSQQVRTCESGPRDERRAACKVACDVDPRRWCVIHGDLARAALDEPGRAEALASYQKACSAQDWLGCYELGDLQEIEGEEAASLASYQKSCDGESALGCGALGRRLEVGRGVARDLVKANYHYAMSCVGGAPAICALLALRGENAPVPRFDAVERAPHFRTAFPALQKDCAGGGLWECLVLGHLLEHGKGAERDTAGAAAAYRNACGRGLQDACNDAAALELTTTGDPAKSAAALRDACTRGSPAACNNAAVLQTGNPFALRQMQGVTVFRLACSETLPLGCTAAPSVAPPAGAARDLPGAAAALEKACDAGVGVACMNLGALHESGLSGARSPRTATALYEKGCAAGAPDGCGTMKAPPFKAGESWIGSYRCAQGQTDLTVRVLDPAADQRVQALFEFTYAPAKVSGRFLMSGAWDDARGAVTFVPGSWVERPSNYVTVGMTGQVSAQRTLFTGKIDDPACGAVRLVRMTSDMIDTGCKKGDRFVDGHGCVPDARPPTALGRWTGKGTESTGASWPMEATITSLEQGRCGKVSYPSLICEGDWYCTRPTDGRALRAREIITSGQARCDSTGFVDLTLSDDQQAADFRWSSPLRKGGSTARLTRAPAP